MKKVIFLLLAGVLSTAGFSQDKIVKKLNEVVNRRDAEAHLTFLASDEMRGRDTGSPEVAIAANYIVAQFKSIGLKPAVNGGYFQEVGLIQSLPPKTVDLKLGTSVFHFKEDMLLIKGKSFTQDAQVVFVGFGSAADFQAVDVKGKIVVAYTGSDDSSKVQQAFMEDSPRKYKTVKDNGGLALIEILKQKEFPWAMVAGFMSGARVSLAPDEDKESQNAMPHLWMRDSGAESLQTLVRQKSVAGGVDVNAPTPKKIPGKNVIGILEGSDPVLSKEYIVLSAHYDHVGVRKNQSPDSIFNGARDNALGTTAILQAAKFISQNPVKRSVIFLAFTGEEKGLLGSRWYADHPVIPLQQTVINLDCDGAGYNDKTIVTLIDLNRTTADALLKKGCETFGLALHGDPVPEQNLFERSDNYSFAAKGVPAVDFSPGIKAFDQELMKYYHQPADEVGSLDFDYVEKFIRSYVYSSWLVANAPSRPVWKAGDKFEAVGKKLYGK